MRSATRIAMILGLLAALAALSPAVGAVPLFGTINDQSIPLLKQQAEHERITRAALACRGGEKPPACFERRSLNELAGTTSFVAGTIPPFNWFGGVGVPDIPLPEDAEAHCDEADYLDVPGYPQSRAQADAEIMSCRRYILERIQNGIRQGNRLTKGKGRRERIRRRDTMSPPFYARCEFSDKRRQANTPRGPKCSTLKGLGRALHAVQDFYAHSNWTDLADPGSPLGVFNPPGLARTDQPDLLNILLRDEQVVIPVGLTTGCFEKREIFGRAPKRCKDRVRHTDLNKDRGAISPRSGKTKRPRTARGKVGGNFQRAVSGAIAETERLWRDFRTMLIAKHGARRGGLMICALTRDNPVSKCQKRVPDVVGLKPSRAIKKLRANGLKANLRKTERCNQGVSKTVGQKPSAKTLVIPGSTVDVAYRPKCLPPPPVSGDWTGTWSTDFGTMYLRQTGSSITGCYTHDSGRISGSASADGAVFTGRWVEEPNASGSDHGDMAFTLGGGTFSGTWTYDAGGGGSWAGSRTGDYPADDPCA